VQSPLTEPKISSVDVDVKALYEWEEQWMSVYRHPDYAVRGTILVEDFGAHSGPLPDFDSDEDEGGPEHLLHCCGADRPPKHRNFSLTVSATAGFLTVHDYVSAVLPWLMGLREKILMASGDVANNLPLPPDTRLMVKSYSTPNYLLTMEERSWKQLSGVLGDRGLPARKRMVTEL
jgi:hypothetical protein